MLQSNVVIEPAQLKSQVAFKNNHELSIFSHQL